MTAANRSVENWICGQNWVSNQQEIERTEEVQSPSGVSSNRSDLDSLLVGLGRGIVLGLVHFVLSGTESAGDTVTDAVVAGNVALGLLLIGLLLSLSGLALDGLRDVVGSVGDRVGDLPDDTLVWCVGVGSRLQ